MNIARAFTVLAVLALATSLVALFAVGSAMRSHADADLRNAHANLAAVAAHLGAAYRGQIAPLTQELSVPLSASNRNSYARRIVAATIGDDEGVDGGFVTRSTIYGDGPQPVVNARERAAIIALAQRAQITGASNSDLALRGGDLVAMEAVPIDSATVAWARERLPGLAASGVRAQVVLATLAALTTAAFGAFCIFVIWRIRRDVRLLLGAIKALETTPNRNSPLPSGDFGTIGRAVVRMANHRIEAEAQARRNERLAALGRVSANVAHEIRNPLNALRLQTALLERRAGGELHEQTQRIAQEIRRLNAVVDAMLAMGADAVVAPEAVDLRRVAERAVAAAAEDARARDVALDLHCTAPAIVSGDEGRLVQLTLNLIVNAIDASPPRSAVEVEVAADALHVRDYGCGMPDDVGQRSFEPFFTTKQHGSGLGLAIADAIAHMHGAQLDYRSRPGNTEFTLTFAQATHV